MKLNEALKNSLATKYPTAEGLIASAKHRKIPMKRLAVFIAAMLALLGVSVSAAIALSGFDNAFRVTIDTGTVEVIAESAEAADFEINVTEVWFDEHNLHLGGIVTTPEPLDQSGRYEIIAHYSINGGEEFSTAARVYPSGASESAFLLTSWQYQGEDGWKRIGATGETAEIALRFERICDWSRDLGDSHIDEYTTHFGEVALLIDARSAEKAPLRGMLNDIEATLNQFTLELVGELGEYHTVFIKLNDGRLIGHEQGDYSWSSESQGRSLFTLSSPLDLTKVESVMIVDEWYIKPSGEEVINSQIEIPLK